MTGTTADAANQPPVAVDVTTTTPLLVAAVCIAFAASVTVGPDGFGIPGNPHAAYLVLSEIRLPRAMLGALIGGALGLSGAVLQGYLRNPLAEPSLLGISGGASLGAVIAIHTGAAGVMALALPIGGLAGGAMAALAIVLLSHHRRATSTLILAGVAISTIAAALTTLALTLAANPFASVEMLFWLLGSLDDRSMLHVWLAGPLIILGSLVLVRTGSSLSALTLGEDAAQNLGVDLRALRRDVVVGTVLAVGAATAVAGTIGFVGLVVPHLLRPHVDHEPGRLLRASLFGGAALVLSADVMLRLVAPLQNIRLGVAISLIGAPFFLWLVVNSKDDYPA